MTLKGDFPSCAKVTVKAAAAPPGCQPGPPPPPPPPASASVSVHPHGAVPYAPVAIGALAASVLTRVATAAGDADGVGVTTAAPT
jgi:hypothetical protein